jgi:hypothetical protein
MEPLSDGITETGRIMSTSNEQSSTSLAGQSLKRPDQVFSPPGVVDLDSLTDGRGEGTYATAYGFSAWAQILLELIYLTAALLGGLAGLFLLAKYAVYKQTSGLVFEALGAAEQSKVLQLYSAIALSGVCGGCRSSLKWLYHSVAKQRWHRDRLIWRLIVPILSGVLAMFTGMMVISGLVPFLARSWLAGLTAASAFGFFVGLFSDNLLAALEKVAFSLFGTMNDRFQKQGGQDNPEQR